MGGGGYGNEWIHNNIFYKCEGVIISKGQTSYRYSDNKGYPYVDASTTYYGDYRSDLPSYFINNTMIDCGR